MTFNPGDTVRIWSPKRGSEGWKHAEFIKYETITSGRGRNKVEQQKAKIRPMGKAKSVLVNPDELQFVEAAKVVHKSKNFTVVHDE